MPKPPTRKPVSKLPREVKEEMKPRPFSPVWKGPLESGITQSLLSLFMMCRERFWVRTVAGLKADSGFSNPIEYGNMWHICEEHYAGGKNWTAPLKAYAANLANTYQGQQEAVNQAYRCCLAQFPVYIDFWKAHEEKKDRSPLLQEVSFKVEYTLPSTRKVLMRGKWDSVETNATNSGVRGIFLQENKTKGEILEGELQRQLSFDLQTLYYLVALKEYRKTQIEEGFTKWKPPILGIKYNVVRRPLSGGRHSIRPHQATKKNPAETQQQFFKRLQDLIKSEPEYFFMRWNVGISMADIEHFEKTFLIPVFEQLCDWWEHINFCGQNQDNRFGPYCLNEGNSRGYGDANSYMYYPHFRLPYGAYNPIANGYSTGVDEYLRTRSTTGLYVDPQLFPELA